MLIVKISICFFNMGYFFLTSGINTRSLLTIKQSIAMKKLFIGLLIIAAGAGAYYLLQKKKSEAFEKEFLIGKWKMDSLYVSSKDSASQVITGITASDSNLHKYQLDFQKGGTILQTLKDSVKADTAWYEWRKDELLIRESAKDSTTKIYTVKKLNIDSLILQSKDSAVLVFKKLN